MPTAMTLSRRIRILIALALAGIVAACQATPLPPTAVSASGQLPAVSGQANAETTGTTFAFEPFTGAPGNIADELSEKIGQEARKQGVTLVRRVGADATYRVNGYLTASGEESSATIFYVFDVVDRNGNRLKRISGTERVSGTKGDPWQAVDGSALSLIAARSMLELKAWLNR